MKKYYFAPEWDCYKFSFQKLLDDDDDVKISDPEHGTIIDDDDDSGEL